VKEASRIADLVARAKRVKQEKPKIEPIPIELLRAGLGYTLEGAEELRLARKAATPEAERQRRRAKNKRARVSRRKNQQIAAQARRRRQKHSARRAA
jgi:hypothetical protein